MLDPPSARLAEQVSSSPSARDLSNPVRVNGPGPRPRGNQRVVARASRTIGGDLGHGAVATADPGRWPSILHGRSSARAAIKDGRRSVLVELRV